MEVVQKIYIYYFWKTYKMKEIIVRTISGILYVSIILFAMLNSREWFVGLFFILGIITMNEFMKLVGLKSYVSYLLLGVAFFFLSYRIIDINLLYIFLLMVLFVNLFLFRDLLKLGKIPLFLNKKYISMIFYIIGGFVFLTLIPNANPRNEFISHNIISVFVLMWANDTFAYLIGKNFGKRKLMERISPKKTIEGFLGGLTGALLISVAIHFVINQYVKADFSYDLWIWMLLAVIISVSGTIGDLIQSHFKRSAGVKDSGIIMPGHGGMYDRLDSIIYASPFVYAFLLIINYVS